MNSPKPLTIRLVLVLSVLATMLTAVGCGSGDAGGISDEEKIKRQTSSIDAQRAGTSGANQTAPPTGTK